MSPIPSREPRRRGYRPGVTALEGRCVPSTLTVTSTADDPSQNHTLRYAVDHAQAGDTIQLTAAVKGPIILTRGELVLSRSVTIKGVPSGTPTISGGGSSRVFEVTPGASVSLVNLAIVGGDGVANNPAGAAGFDGNGGAILNDGTLSVAGCTLSNNAGTPGPSNGYYTFAGAILNNGMLTVSGSTLSANSSDNGGAIADFGTMTISGSTFSKNNAGLGGAVAITGGATIVHSAVLENTASGGVGGGIFFFSGTMTLSDSTVTGNSAALGGGVANQLGVMTINGGLIAGNSASVGGGGIFTFGPSTSYITGTAFTDDTSAIFGGAISNAGYIQIGNAAFTGNAAEGGSGGGIDSIGVVVVDGTTFTNNTAATVGGGISSAGYVYVTGSEFIGNTASAGGGIANFGLLYVGTSDFLGNFPDDILGPYFDLGGNGSIVNV